jgi:uncharacterized protein
MKYLLLVVVLALVFSMLARKRARPPAAKPEPQVQPKAALSMVTCAQCGLHLPLDEALPGQGGVFCSAAHRAAFEAERGANS